MDRSPLAALRTPLVRGALPVLALALSGAAVGAASPEPPPGAGSMGGHVPLTGFVEAADLPTHGSAGFVLMDGAYHFIQAPGAEDTSIAALDEVAGIAYGWSRDLPVDDPLAVESSWVLDLSTGEFTPITIEDTNWVVVRGMSPSGQLVGKLSDDAGTPDDDTDDGSRGFIHDLATGSTTRVAREGYEDIGFTAINGSGVIAGFNDFGTVGFLYVDGGFIDLTHPDAYRLFPFQIADDVTIVGFWGTDEETWYLNGVSPSFVGHWDGESVTVERYAVPGFTGTGLTALNDAGMIGGLVYPTPESVPVVFLAQDTSRMPELHPLPAHLSPFLTGITESGIGFGQVGLSEPVEATVSGDADAALMDAADALVQQVRRISGPAHSGPFSRAIHGLFHELEEPALAAREAIAGDDIPGATAHLDELDAALARTRQVVIDHPDAATAEGTELLTTLDDVEAAAAALRSAMASSD